MHLDYVKKIKKIYEFEKKKGKKKIHIPFKLIKTRWSRLS